MKTATINISHCIQDMQNMSTNENALVMASRIFFSMEIGDARYSNLYVDIAQPYGTDYESEPIEVGPPVGYKGPFNHKKFSEEIENYYRSLVGSQGGGIVVAGGNNIRMRNNTFYKAHIFTFELPVAIEGAW